MPLVKRSVQTHKRSRRIGVLPIAAVAFSMGCMALALPGCFSPAYPTLDGGEEARKKEVKGRHELAVQDALTELDQLIRTASQAKRELARVMSRADARLSELAELREMTAKEFLIPDESFTAVRNGDDSPPDAVAAGDDSEELQVVNGWTRFGHPRKNQEISPAGSAEKEEGTSLASVDDSEEPYVVNGWTYLARPQKISEVSPDDFGKRDEWPGRAPVEPEQADQLAATTASEPEGVPEDVSEAARIEAPVARVEVRILHVQPEVEVQTMQPPRDDGGIALPKAEVTGLLPYPRESFLVKMAEEVAARREEEARRQALEPLQPLVPEEKAE